MTKSAKLTVVLAASALSGVVALGSGNLFEGEIRFSLDPASNPVLVSAAWNQPTTHLTWSIGYDAVSNPSHPWQYSYTWSTDRKDLSHIIIEISRSATSGNFEGLPRGTEGPGNFGPQGNSNPGIPEALKGLKFEGGDTEVSFSFFSDRAPTWGDFYAKDGVDGQGANKKDVYAHNTGFTSSDTDPVVDFAAIALGDLTTFRHDGDRAAHIAVPDSISAPITVFTSSAVVPESGTVLAALGLGGVAVLSVRRRLASR